MSSATERPGKRPRLLFASTNPGKLREARALLRPLPVDLVGLADLGLSGEVEEDAPDYHGNARKKARHWAHASGLATLAEDSGIEVAALGGRPGVLSARYGGPGVDDRGRNDLLLAELAAVAEGERGARYVSVVVLVSGDGTELAALRGACEGRIARAPRGEGGFGYDPLFEVDFGRGGGLTFAQMPPEAKDRRSHRGRALRDLVRRLAAKGEGLAAFLAGKTA